jgi:hypothetical protein
MGKHCSIMVRKTGTSQNCSTDRILLSAELSLKVTINGSTRDTSPAETLRHMYAYSNRTEKGRRPK